MCDATATPPRLVMYPKGQSERFRDYLSTSDVLERARLNIEGLCTSDMYERVMQNENHAPMEQPPMMTGMRSARRSECSPELLADALARRVLEDRDEALNQLRLVQEKARCASEEASMRNDLTRQLAEERDSLATKVRQQAQLLE